MGIDLDFYKCQLLNNSLLVGDEALVSLFKPFDGVILCDLVALSDAGLPRLALAHPSTGAGKHDVEVHAINASGGIVLNAEVNVFVDAEPEAACVAEVGLLQLILFDLQPSLDDLQRFGPAHGDVGGDLLVTTDGETSHRVSCLRCHGFLLRDLVQHTHGLGQLIAAAAGRDVEHEFVHLYCPHDVFLGASASATATTTDSRYTTDAVDREGGVLILGRVFREAEQRFLGGFVDGDGNSSGESTEGGSHVSNLVIAPQGVPVIIHQLDLHFQVSAETWDARCRDADGGERRVDVLLESYVFAIVDFRRADENSDVRIARAADAIHFWKARGAQVQLQVSHCFKNPVTIPFLE